MTKHLIISAASAVLLFSLSTSSAFAENSGPGGSAGAPQRNEMMHQMKEKAANTAGLEGTKAMDRVGKMQATSGDLKTRAQEELQKRIAKLNQALEKVSTSDSLSAEEKAKMTADLQKELTDLQSLATKVTATTDLNAIKEDVKMLKQSHGEYSLHGPRTGILHSAEKIVKLSDKMASLGAKLDTKLDALEANGQDVTSQRTLLSSLLAKAVSAKTKAQNVIATVSALTTDGTEANKTALTNARLALKDAQTDIKAAHQDAKNILKSLPKTGTPTPSVSASE